MNLEIGGRKKTRDILGNLTYLAKLQWKLFAVAAVGKNPTKFRTSTPTIPGMSSCKS